MASTSTLTSHSQSTHSQSVALPAMAAPVVLLGRFLFSLIFLLAAPINFSGKTIAFAASQGVPLASIAVPLSGIIALAGALSILLGYRARIGVWLIVLFLAVVTPALHNFWAVTDPMMHQMQFVMFLKNLSMMGGALFISQTGSGPWSLDARSK
ncbi:MAG: DoxX family protein [Candidatus Sulfotelmatobacter sp.]